MSQEEILLVYDKQCPVCDGFCQAIRIRESIGHLKIVDARAKTAVMDEITQRGLDIDQGMVLKRGGDLYYGSDAIHARALISSRSGIFNRLNYWVFKSKTVGHMLYPVLRIFRNLLLKALGKSRINNLGMPGNGKF
jgi:predicted DCC family thiol-disulfide oxidoreductase YuxK